ncbi:MAG: response regulator transcription factor [Ignavibacteriales bacterium]
MEILIVEDEKRIAESLKKNFLSEGHHAMIAEDGEEALKKVDTIEFDAILLDWRLPKLSGFEVCKRIRETGNQVPIILLTAMSDLKNKIEAFNVGADDYITKPFSFEEVSARINAVSRRVRNSRNEIMFDDYTLNMLTRTLNFGTEEIRLSDKEFELLRYFLMHRGEIISKEKLSEDVWKLPFSPSSNLVEVTVKNLRKKLELNSDKNFIRTLYGEGYIFINE